MDNKYIESKIKMLAPYLTSEAAVPLLRSCLESTFLQGHIEGLGNASEIMDKMESDRSKVISKMESDRSEVISKMESDRSEVMDKAKYDRRKAIDKMFAGEQK